MKIAYNAANEQETINLGEKLGHQLKGGEILQLIGDLGAGKTTLVKGIAAAIGCKEDVTSPTFTVCNVYSGKLTVYHCDFYRLHDDYLIQKELEDMIDNDSVVIMEWAENLRRLPGIEAISVTISYTNTEARTFDITIPETMGYISL